MNRLIPFLMVVLAAGFTACSSSTEFMSDTPDGGRKYLWHDGQIGGQGTWQNSMGSAGAFDGQKSLADVVQGVVSVKGFSAATKQLLYREVTKRYQIGQITAQQKIAADLAIGQSTNARELQVALAQIAAGQ